MIRFNQELSGRLRQLAVECSGAPGFDSITGHRLYATIARERFVDMSEGQLAIVEYCAGACIRQDDADVPMAVFDMVCAYDYALANLDPLQPVGVQHIKTMYRLVKPALNPFGFRSMPVLVGERFIPADALEQQIGQLCEEQDGLNAEEFYLWFEHYHAGNDGNGRVGAILFNLKNGTLAQPVLAPHYRDPRTLAQSSAFGEIEP